MQGEVAAGGKKLYSAASNAIGQFGFGRTNLANGIRQKLPNMAKIGQQHDKLSNGS